MGGALLQLVALGQQDTFLSGNPQITFWKVVYKRHTNFAIESIRQTHTGNYPNYTYTISRSGDLIHKCYLRVKVPRLGDGTNTTGNWLSYVNKFGHALIESMSLKIGGVTIDTQTGEFLDIWNQLTMTTEKQDGYNAMVGIYETDIDLEFNNKERTYYIPLQFFFCQNPGLSLPLIALQYHEVQLDFDFRSFKDMLCCNDTSDIDTLLNDSQFGIQNAAERVFNIDLYVDYVYLDVDERRRMAQTSHEMLITQTKQIQHVISSGVDRDRIDLKNLNHPIKELIWVAKSNNTMSEPKNYFDFGNEHSITSGDDTSEIMKTASLTLNGTLRIEERDSLFYRCIQPYQHHTRIPMDYIYVYSFALKPEEVQPSGSCNFSRMDNAYLNVTNYKAPSMSEAFAYHIYALNWNVLRIQSGQAGIAFTN